MICILCVSFIIFTPLLHHGSECFSIAEDFTTFSVSSCLLAPRRMITRGPWLRSWGASSSVWATVSRTPLSQSRS